MKCGNVQSMKHRIRRRLFSLGASMILATLAAPAFAQMATAPPAVPPIYKYPVGSPQQRSMDTFLDGHPSIASDLQRHPGLVDNKEYMEHHPELREYFTKHPLVGKEFREHPQQFMTRQRRYDSRERGMAPPPYNNEERAERLHREQAERERRQELRHEHHEKVEERAENAQRRRLETREQHLHQQQEKVDQRLKNLGHDSD
jgi:hypothetical protein